MNNLQIACDKDLILARRRGLLRARALWFLKLSLTKHNIKNLYYCMGPEFQSGDDVWDMAQGPNGETCLLIAHVFQAMLAPIVYLAIAMLNKHV